MRSFIGGEEVEGVGIQDSRAILDLGEEGFEEAVSIGARTKAGADDEGILVL